jgi:nucleoside-diphosphate-sugar epimerase
MGVTAEVEYEPMRAGDVVCSKGDSTRLQGWTGWQALTTLSAGLAETLAWRRTQ